MQSTTLPVSVSAAEAAALLGVKAQTLYAYASRGLLRRVGLGKRRRYLLEDVDRLLARQRARSGHGPVAAAALSFGEPVLDTSITRIDECGPLYRGLPAVQLARQGHCFEAVAELLWCGQLPPAPPRWPALAARLGGECRSLEQLLGVWTLLAGAAPERLQRAPASEVSLARKMIRTLALLLVRASHRRATGSIAELLGASCRGVAPETASAALDLALVLLADHELNASTFAARIAASTDASLPACLLAALATLSGPRHGGACDRVEALLDEAYTLPRASDVLKRRIQRGDVVPGFGHPLYPVGDPRAELLLQRARALGRSATPARLPRVALALARSMQALGLPATVDFGLVALTRALGMPSGSAALLFALGRSAGWVAHVLEQRGSGAVLRPRARWATTPAVRC